MFDATRPAPKKFELQGGIKQLRVERHNSEKDGEGAIHYDYSHTDSRGIHMKRRKETDGWCIWLAANATFSIGTYLLLRDDGSIARVTIQASGEEYVFEYEE